MTTSAKVGRCLYEIRVSWEGPLVRCALPWRHRGPCQPPVTPPPAVRDSRTSQEAARALEPTVQAHLQRAVWLAISRAGVEGLIDEEGITITGIPASTYRPRRVELVRQGRAYDSGYTRPTRSGRKATVWRTPMNECSRSCEERHVAGTTCSCPCHPLGRAKQDAWKAEAADARSDNRTSAEASLAVQHEGKQAKEEA